MALLSPAARAAAIAAADQEALRRAGVGTLAPLADHVKAIVDAALDAAEEAESCPYPGCIVEHRDHPGRHVSAAMVDHLSPQPRIVEGP